MRTELTSCSSAVMVRIHADVEVVPSYRRGGMGDVLVDSSVRADGASRGAELPTTSRARPIVGPLGVHGTRLEARRVAMAPRRPAWPSVSAVGLAPARTSALVVVVNGSFTYSGNERSQTACRPEKIVQRQGVLGEGQPSRAADSGLRAGCTPWPGFSMSRATWNGTAKISSASAMAMRRRETKKPGVVSSPHPREWSRPRDYVPASVRTTPIQRRTYIAETASAGRFSPGCNGASSESDVVSWPRCAHASTRCGSLHRCARAARAR